MSIFINNNNNNNNCGTVYEKAFDELQKRQREVMRGLCSPFYDSLSGGELFTVLDLLQYTLISKEEDETVRQHGRRIFEIPKGTILMYIEKYTDDVGHLSGRWIHDGKVVTMYISPRRLERIEL